LRQGKEILKHVLPAKECINMNTKEQHRRPVIVAGRFLSIFIVVGLILATASPVRALVAGDVGTFECRALQLNVQTAVSAGGPY
jgi:hypothetical protein